MELQQEFIAYLENMISAHTRIAREANFARMEWTATGNRCMAQAFKEVLAEFERLYPAKTMSKDDDVICPHCDSVDNHTDVTEFHCKKCGNTFQESA
jgi:DNA-directed RNA polymerase subunit RPC12/RpoP